MDVNLPLDHLWREDSITIRTWDRMLSTRMIVSARQECFNRRHIFCSGAPINDESPAVVFPTDKPIEEEVNKIIKQKQKFERMVITKEEGLELFADNPFKVEILSTKVADGSRTTVYRCGDLIDLCRGPHVVHTGKVKAFAATRHSATNWKGDTDNDSLQRMYGISFPDKKMLKAWKENQEKVSHTCPFIACYM